ncbi:Protein virilizer [Sergentomyia squamirostris]
MEAVVADDLPELLFFDTFSHEINEEINLDLVQFPRPVYITEIRIIPLGARVEADFPGGVRLGATNPSKFSIDFFVNDLSRPGASTFEILGRFEYNQNDCIHLECPSGAESTVRQIPTDGLVLRGWYTTITLAVYGTHTKNITEQIASPPAVGVTAPVADVTSVQAVVVEEPKKEWTESAGGAPVPTLEAKFPHPGTSGDIYQGQYYENQEYQPENYSSAVESVTVEKNDVAKDPRTYLEEKEEENLTERRTRGRSHDQAREGKDFEEGRKRPKTPPSDSPKRPRSPEGTQISPAESDDEMGKGQPIRVIDHTAVPEERSKRRTQSPSSTTGTPLESPAAIEEDIGSSGEQFEPILSDEDIGDDDSADSQFDMDFECEDYTEEFLKSFNPFTAELTSFTPRPNKQLTKEFDSISRIIEKFQSRFFKDLSWKKFPEMSFECKENWVYSTERILQYLGSIYQYERSLVLPYIKSLLEDETKGEIITQWIAIGLSYDAATSQQTYKVRHLKAGIRMCEYLGCYEDIARILIKGQKFDVFGELFSLYHQEYMALSLQLLILRAVSSLLDTKFSMEYFLGEADNPTNRYQDLLKMVAENPKICVKFALKALVKKINLYESLMLIRDMTSRCFTATGGSTDDDMVLLSSCLGEVINAYTWDEKSYAQPKGLFPIVKKIEHVHDPLVRRATTHGFTSYFRIHSILECLLVLVTNSHGITVDLMAKTLKMIVALVRSVPGLNYLTEMITTTNLLQRSLLHEAAASEDVYPNPGREIKSHRIALEIIYRVQTKYHLDAITGLKGDDDELVEQLLALHTLTMTRGKCYVVSCLTMEGNINTILGLINSQKNFYAEHPESGKIKSPILNYAVDILDCVIRSAGNVSYLVETAQQIVSIVKSHEIFESSVSAMLQEVAIYMKPLEIDTIFSYNDVQSLCEVIKRSFDFFTTFPGDLITALRITRHLAIPEAYGEEIEKWNEQDEDLELRYKFFVMQFYSSDGLSLLTSILEKMVNFYQQPSVHIAALASNQGVLTLQILLPALQVLRKTLTAVILARNTHFRDTTSIDLLFQVYNLTYCVPRTGAAYADAQMAQEEIVKTLLVYTQPAPEEGVDTESVRKSLWTHLIGDLIKFTLKGPSTFLPGLLIFSELLPLPLPIPTKQPLSDAEASKIVTERQLWSAHLHPQSGSLVELIQSLCTSSYPQLILLLSRVCLQLADLAPNMSLMVSKTITNLILAEPLISGVATSHQSRLINFFASLVSHPSVKVSVLSILPGKLMEFLMAILSTENSSSAHIQAQENVYEALQALLDSEITMIAPKNAKSRELALACAFPSKELLQPIVNCVLDNFTMDSVPCPLTALRTMLLMSEHDVMINLLFGEFVKRKSGVGVILRKLVTNFTENVDQNRGIIETLIDFLRTMFIIEGVEENGNQLIPPRTLIVSGSQLASMVNWRQEKVEGEEAPELHALELLQKFLKQEEICEKHQLDGLLENCRQIVEFIDKEGDPAIPDPILEVNIDAALPQAEGIVTQYSSRIIFDTSECIGERLTVNYWLNSPICSKDLVEDMEQIPCDLSDMIRTCLPPETNIVSDCKRLLHLVVSPQTTRERPIAAPCFRTRRVEVEPSTGRPEKKIFVTPMRGRGYPRTPQSRGDLFRSRPPNTSRPPSLHVDDFLALETCGAQPTGPTGYNKISRDIISIRGNRGGRGRGGFASDRGRVGMVGANGSGGGGGYRNSSTTWTNPHLTSHMMVDQTKPPGHFRTAGESTSTGAIIYGGDYPESQSHFGGAATRARMTRGFLRSSARNFTR